MKVIDLIIMKINEEEMPKHVLINRMNYYYDDEIESYRDEEGSRMVLDFTSNVFSMPVKIIEDEFIDIEELDGSIGYINWNSEAVVLTNAINDLIKNQKKIINKLKEEGK